MKQFVLGIAVVFALVVCAVVLLRPGDERIESAVVGVVEETGSPEGDALAKTSSAVERRPEVGEQAGDPAELEFDWQIDLGERVRIVDTSEPPSVSVSTLLRENSIGASAETDLYLFRALKFCWDAPRDSEAYETQRLKLLTTRSVNNLPVLTDSGPAERVLAAKFELCRGLTRDDFETMEPRLRVASDSGLSEAQLEYAHFKLDYAKPGDLTEAQVAEYFGLVQQAKESGDAGAYFWSGFSGLAGANGRGKVESIADLIVAEAVFRQLGRTMNLAPLVEREYQLLYPGQRDEARSRAMEMISADSCCAYVYGKTWEEKLGAP